MADCGISINNQRINSYGMGVPMGNGFGMSVSEVHIKLIWFSVHADRSLLMVMMVRSSGPISDP